MRSRSPCRFRCRWRTISRVGSTKRLLPERKPTRKSLRCAISSEVASNLAEVKRLRQAVLDYQSTLMPMAESNLNLAQESYAQGQLTITEVVQTARQQSELDLAYLNTLNLY